MTKQYPRKALIQATTRKNRQDKDHINKVRRERYTRIKEGRKNANT